MVQPFQRGLQRPIYTDVLDGDLARLEDLLVAEYIMHEYDVLIIGAGGAGLRAAVEASAAGVKVAVISKSLLGKAHTVMAEGGVAASISAVRVRTYVCPAEIRSAPKFNTQGDVVHVPPNYAANQGPWFVFNPVNREGSPGARFGIGSMGSVIRSHY